MSAPSTEDGLWIGDLFARCWDHLTQSDVNRIITAGIREALDPTDAAVYASLSASVDGQVPQAVLDYLAGAAPLAWRLKSGTADEATRHFVVARAIDRLLGQIHPFGDRPKVVPAGLRRLHEQYRRSGSFAKMPGSVVVPQGPIGPLARVAARGAVFDPGSGNHKSQLFKWVTRSTDPALSVGPPIGGRKGPAIEINPAHIKVAVVPWAEHEDYLDLRSEIIETIPWVHVSVPPRSETDLDARAAAVVKSLIEQAVTIAVLPEFVVTPAAVEALQRVLKQAARNQSAPALELIIAGSGMSVACDGNTGLAHNESVVLSRYGRVLWRQRKCHQYAMEPSRMRTYGLDAAICSESRHRERFHPGHQIEVRDTALGRSLVLICEDLAQMQSGRPIIDALRPDWLFVPVLDGELLFGRWIHQHILPIARDHGTNSIVATSLTLPLRENPNKARYSVGLCIAGPFDRTTKTGETKRCAGGSAFPLEVATDAAQPRVAVTPWSPRAWSPTRLSRFRFLFKPQQPARSAWRVPRPAR